LRENQGKGGRGGPPLIRGVMNKDELNLKCNENTKLLVVLAKFFPEFLFVTK